MFCVITNIYNKKTKGPTLMELFTATGKLKKFFLTTRDVRCMPCHPWHTHRTSVVAKKKLFPFSCGCEQFHEGRSSGFLMNVCNHGEYYETPVFIETLTYLCPASNIVCIWGYKPSFTTVLCTIWSSSHSWQ